ncbi:hypothetical protein AB0F65_29555 [Nocardia rhamnosiphila]|uniref:hypothetical protein n=1 Tax=Nocardia rhamnosiphila TaxID=426716 RepID=UPI0033E7EC92
MVVADTNVVSEPFKPTPGTRLLSWLQKSTDITITTVTIGEIWAGIENLPESTRKAGNVKDFTDLGITIINPWQPTPDSTLA